MGKLAIAGKSPFITADRYFPLGVVLLEAASELGNHEAFHILGDLYHGITYNLAVPCTEQNLQKSVDFYRKALEPTDQKWIDKRRDCTNKEETVKNIEENIQKVIQIGQEEGFEIA